MKCDEGRPSCARCVKAGRECAGYAPWRDLSPPKRSPSPQDLVATRAANADEDLLFRVFLEDGGSQSVVRSDVQFWKVLIPQLCEAEPAIRYASLAIGALMLQQRSISGFSESGPESRSALVYYNKSIQSLLSPQNPVSKDTALVSNILFTCMECMQGRDLEAFGLFHQGRRMFEEQWDKQDQPSEIMHRVRSVLARLRLVALLYGPPMADYRSPITGSDSETPQHVFNSYDEARSAFFYLSGDIHAIISETSHAKLAHTSEELIVAQLAPEQEVLRLKLQRWKQRFMPLVEPALYISNDPAEQIAVLTLQCQAIMMNIWTVCCLRSTETTFDAYTGSFQKILDISGRVIALLEKANLARQAFSLEIGIIGPLYLTGRMCRDRAMRRRVIELLQQGRRQEGLWQASQTITILQRIYEIEEASMLPGEDLPGETARLRTTLLHPRKTGISGERGNTVQFFLTAEDPSQGWEVWEEWFKA